MPLSFFIAETGEFYASMDGTSLDGETYDWLSRNRIELGRKTSFKVAKESPKFDTIQEAETWLSVNWFPDARWVGDSSATVSDESPNEEHYRECAQIANEINEISAGAKLAEILKFENDHSFLCKVGVWYWSIGHMRLALMAYRRSLELQPEAATYFNLAVCHDDLGEPDPATYAMNRFYDLVASDEERESAESMLREQGKEHLTRRSF
jgi:tetratricopeptide (TPR) repeat protein